MVDENGQPMSGRNSLYNSGFNGTFGCPTCDNDTSKLTELTTGYDFPDSKYYDSYQYAITDEAYQMRILGDATGEMGPFADITYLTRYRQIGSWYTDQAFSINLNGNWVMKGGVYSGGTDVGLFALSYVQGHSGSSGGFRIVLTLTGGNL